MAVAGKRDAGPVSHSLVRRLEAVSFRAFPSTTTRYNGTWAIRLTGGHPAKRLNSVNPLDPRDDARIDQRIGLAARRFADFGRPLIFRLTPLAPQALRDRLASLGWREFEESIVMTCDLGALDFAGLVEQLPLQDHGKWIDAYLMASGEDASRKPGLAEILSATEPATGLFVVASSEGAASSVVRCVHELGLAGIFDLATLPQLRARGLGRKALLTALYWAQRQGANQAWLQVVADNEPALSLYRSLGFAECYRYSYWTPGGEE